MQLPNAQVGHGDGRRKNSKTGEHGSYYTAQVGTTQLRLALHSSGWHYTAQVGPEDREERRGKNGLDMILI